jgi:hypothetical protein
MKPREVRPDDIVFRYGGEFDHKQFVSPSSANWCGLYRSHLINDMRALILRAEREAKHETGRDKAR